MSSESPCTISTPWWIFPVISAGLYVVGFSLALLSNFLLQRFHESSASRAASKVRKSVGFVISNDCRVGQALAVVNLFCNTAYLCLTIYYYSSTVLTCRRVEASSPDIVLEVLISIPLVVLFALRAVAAESWRHWLLLRTVVDVFTLPHAFLVMMFMEDWLGLRVLRFVWLTQLAQVIQLFPCAIAKSQDVIRLTKILCRFLSLWLVASGIVLLLERHGDPWSLVPSESWENLTYFDSMYFIMVTMSTVGYGDISTGTVLGKLFMILFILAGLAVVAVALPSLIEITVSFYQTSRFQQMFHPSQVSHFIVVCGHVTPHSAKSFLKELLHPDRHDRLTHVLFLHPEIPSDELRSVLKSYYTRVKFYKGSPLSSKDLKQCKVNKAKAVVILVDKESPDPIEEDRANLLRTVAIKRACKNIKPPKCILQLHNPRSQDLLQCVPNWSPNRDVVLCLNELKLSILAMTCLTPGFCTLISNLFFTTADQPQPTNQSQQGSHSWETLYTGGACFEMYSAKFSDYFHGKSVGHVARICYKELKVTLLTVVGLDPSGKVCNGTEGFFIANTARDVQLVSSYCVDENCKHVRGRNQRGHHHHRRYSFRKAREPSILMTLVTNSSAMEAEECSSSENELQQMPLERKAVELPDHLPVGTPPLQDHVVLCVFGSASSSEIGLDRFVHILRSSSNANSNVAIVIVGNREYMEKEWASLHTHSQVFLICGSPLNWSNLTQAGVRSCRACIILTAASKKSENEYGAGNKEAILCALTLKKYSESKKSPESNIPYIIDLPVEDHIHLLHNHTTYKQEAYLSEPFACGHAFLSSVFDSMTTVAFHSPPTIKLLEGLLGISTESGKATRSRSMKMSTDYGEVTQLSVKDLYSSCQLDRGTKYGTLYDTLTEKGFICVGLYRKLHKQDTQRYLITAPPPEIPLQESDIVLALTSSHWGTPTSQRASVSELVASTSMAESIASLIPCQTEINLEPTSISSDRPDEQA